MGFPPVPEINGLPIEYVMANGRVAYLNPYTGKYTASRSYAQRMQRNFARGIPQSAARGHRAVGGVSESQIRRQREIERYGPETTPTQRFYFGFRQRYGYDYSYWRRLRRLYIGEINDRALPNPHSNRMIVIDGQRKDPRVFPSDVASVKQLYDQGYRDNLIPAPSWEAWIEQRLAERLDAIQEFQDMHNVVPGRSEYQSRTATWYNINLVGDSVGPPIELWWYH